ncbi:hypothetical protein Nizo1839_2442 [Lactiplantibacillus plantarum]|nr:hypothetical protein Nizo1839_2442 [Lactiplantibacillus plantarum]
MSGVIRLPWSRDWGLVAMHRRQFDQWYSFIVTEFGVQMGVRTVGHVIDITKPL